MIPTRTLIDDLAKRETRVALSLKNGVHHEGYLLDVGAEGFELALGGPLAPEEPVFIEHEAVDPDSPSCYDEAERRYRGATAIERSEPSSQASVADSTSRTVPTATSGNARGLAARAVDTPM